MNKVIIAEQLQLFFPMKYFSCCPGDDTTRLRIQAVSRFDAVCRTEHFIPTDKMNMYTFLYYNIYKA